MREVVLGNFHRDNFLGGSFLEGFSLLPVFI